MKAGNVFYIYLVLLLACLTLSAPVIAQAQVSESNEVDYFAAFMEGKKVGHAIQSRVVSEGKVTTSEDVSMTISRGDVPVTMDAVETSIETTAGEPLGFEAEQRLSMMTMKVTGTVDKQGIVSITTTVMGQEQKSTLEWPVGAIMSEGLRLLTLKKGLEEGTQYTAKVFSAVFIGAIDVQIRVGPKQNVDLLGRVVELTKVTTTYNIPGTGEVITTSYVDEKLRNQKVVMPMGDMQVELLTCAKEFALGENDVFEVIDKMFLKSPVPLDNVGLAKSIVYHISPTPGTDSLKIPAGDSQKVQQLEDGKVIVTVGPVMAPAGAQFPYQGSDSAILEAMKPTRYVQSDRKEIIDLARQAVGDTKDVAGAVQKIEAFVARYVENRSLSVGYASAAEVAASKQGDCSEFAVLTAALCRAVGIPAQVVTGIAYVDDWAGFQGFGGHAWVRAYVGDKWIDLDAAFKRAGLGGYDAGHIALAVGNGDPEGFFNIVGTIGRFKIDNVTINKD